MVYAKILGGVTRDFQVLDEQPVSVALIITLVRRPAFGQWMVHGLGGYLRPEEVPHG